MVPVYLKFLIHSLCNNFVEVRIPGLPGDVFRIWETSGLSDCPCRWEPRSKLSFQGGELIEASEFLLGASWPSFHAVFPITRRMLWFIIYCNAETVHGVIKDSGLQIWEENVRKWLSCSLTPDGVLEFGPGRSGDSGFGLFQQARFTSGTSWFRSFPLDRQTGSKMNLALFNCVWWEPFSFLYLALSLI